MTKFDPFVVKASGKDIKDRDLPPRGEMIDGDILVAPSLSKHPQLKWTKYQNSKLLFLLAVVLFAGLGLKLFHLQIARGQEYYAQAENNRTRKIFAPAPRGVIFSSDGQKLAFNEPNFALYVIPGDLPAAQEEEDKIFSQLEKILGAPAYDLIESFIEVPRSSFEPYELKRGLSQEQAVTLQQKVKNWQGIMLKPVEQRTYVENETFSHVLGYTGKMTTDEYVKYRVLGYNLNEYTGKAGLEKEYQDSLRGQAGYTLIEVDSLGKEKNAISELPAKPGANLYLHLDAALQNFIWQELGSMLEKIKAKAGSALVMDPRTGAILALASFPGYKNWELARGLSAAQFQELLGDEQKPLFNRAIAGEYPSGSTFKIVVGAGALSDGLIDENFTVASAGGLTVNGYHFPDWKAGGHGLTNIIKALSQSVNTFFYVIGGGLNDFSGLGLERITHYAKLFGLSELTGIDLPGEQAGFLPSRQWKQETTGERWFLGDTYHLAIGQGSILVTPLQVANFTSVIANGGTLFKPQIAAYWEEAGQKKIISPEIVRTDFLSRDAVRTIARGLREAAITGSASSLSALPVSAAGKTGTAEIGGGLRPHAWFTGFAPYERPELVVTIMIEQGEGGNISATPIAKKIFEWYFNNDKIQKSSVK